MERIIGWLFLVFGFAASVNAVVAGPRAFSGGEASVAQMVGAGLVCASCGAWLLLRGNFCSKKARENRSSRAKDPD